MIATNAGGEGATVLQRVKAESGTTGYDASSDRYVDMVSQGIVDPTKVTRIALQNAASVAALLLTTEALITELPEEKKPAMPPGGGHHDMDMDY
jgi:chaperonin GroEL